MKLFKEIGIRGNLSLLDYEIAGFHIDIKNLVAAGRGTAFKNLGKVNSQGVEVRSDFLFSKIGSNWTGTYHQNCKLLTSISMKECFDDLKQMRSCQ